MTKKNHPPYFDGKKYHNIVLKQENRTIRHLMRWLMTRKRSKWPKQLSVQQKTIPVTRTEVGQLRATFINHSTALLQLDGLNILTDPIWSKRCGPFRWAGLKRVAPPGVRFEDLPPIDLVLVSHNHYDHMDLPTLKKLYRKHKPVFCVPLGNRGFLEAKGLRNIFEFNWWEEKTCLGNLKITFVPAEHFSRRGLWDDNKTLWGGYVLKGSTAPIYFAGDTALGPHFEEIYKKFGPVRLALLPIGAYSPRWFMSSVHMSPEDAVNAHLILKAKLSIGIHFGTFRLSDEAYDDPIIELTSALKKKGVRAQEFLALSPGEGYDVP